MADTQGAGTAQGQRTTSDAAEAPVLAEVRGRLGIITLNRPRAVNALTAQMVRLMWAQLVAWAHDDTVGAVAVRGAGERGLCAGGDIVALHADMTRPDRHEDMPYESMDFWRDEYRLNELISRYPKPYVALMDGLVLGGGIGVSAHGSHRLVTERTRSGLPETQIGFSPDVGGTYLLGHAPGATGQHAGLTGAHLDAGDALYLGLADTFVNSEDLEAILTALETEEPDAVVARFAQPAPSSDLEAAREWIDAAYTPERTAAQIVAALEEAGGDAAAAAEVIRSKSPTAVTVALASIRAGAGEDLATSLKREYRVGHRFLTGNDFAEGIRAQVIDKDRTPHWDPATLESVPADTAARFLAPLPNQTLDLSPVDSALQA